VIIRNLKKNTLDLFAADELSKEELGAHIPRVWEAFFRGLVG
jgi:hypothetical protein